MMKFAILLSAACVTLSLQAAPAPKQQAKQQAKPLQGPVLLKDQKDVDKHVSAFPRVQVNAAVPAPVAARINASLEKLDQNVAGAASDCAAQFQESQGKPSVDGWERSITVTMKGPDFLSLEANDFVYCGGAHPDTAQLPMVYDLATGRPVDWIKLLPAGAGVQGGRDSSADGTTLGIVTWPELQKRARAQAEDECKSAFAKDEKVSFAFSMDGSAGKLLATPTSLPHVIAACANAVELSAADVRKLHISGRVADALEAAQKLQR